MPKSSAIWTSLHFIPTCGDTYGGGGGVYGGVIGGVTPPLNRSHVIAGVKEHCAAHKDVSSEAHRRWGDTAPARAHRTFRVVPLNQRAGNRDGPQHRPTLVRSHLRPEKALTGGSATACRRARLVP